MTSMPRMIRSLAWAATLAATLLMSACNAPGDTPAGESPAVADPTAPASAPPPGPAAKPVPPSTPLVEDAGRSCRNDSDCALKDAGSCCGYRPVCVNKDTPTFPEKVQAACARDGRMGICGFPAIEGCQCVAGKCEGVLMMENSVPLQ